MREHLAAVQGELDTLVKIITETVPTERIYLFGSYANGTPDKDSDLDIYVVMKDDAAIKELDAMLAIRAAMRGGVNMPVDLLALRFTPFMRYSKAPSIERTIVREGMKLYG